MRIWAGNLQPTCSIESTVRKIMSFPLFPLPIEALQATVEFRDFRAGDPIELRAGVNISHRATTPSGGATGYRIEHDGRSVAYITDVEIGDGPIDPALLALAKGVDLLILDTTYTDDELPSAHVGWAIPSWQQVSGWQTWLRSAGALLHHDPEHDDRFMDGIATAAASAAGRARSLRAKACIFELRCDHTCRRAETAVVNSSRGGINDGEIVSPTAFRRARWIRSLRTGPPVRSGVTARVQFSCCTLMNSR